MNVLKYVVVWLFVTLLLGSACSRKYRLTQEVMLQPSAWPYHRGELAGLGAKGGGFSGRLDMVWENSSSDKPAGPPTLYHGVLVYPGSKGNIKFFDKHTGKYLGRWRSKSPAQTGLVIKDSLAFYGTPPSRNKLHCVDLRRGRSLWSRRVKDAAEGTILVGNRLIVASAEGTLVAFDSQDGQQAWRFESDGRFTAPPVFGAGLVLQPGDAGILYGISVDDGEEVYRVTLAGPLTSAVAVSELIYATDMSGQVYGIDPNDGHIVWQTELDGDIWTTPAVSDGRLFVGHSGGELVALDVATGDVLWRYKTIEVVRASATIAGTSVIVGTLGGKLVSLDVTDGSVVDERQLRGAIKRAPVTDGERVYVVTNAGMIVCFGDAHEGLNQGNQRASTYHQPQ